MLFCPLCGNLLAFAEIKGFTCPTCPFLAAVSYAHRETPANKARDDVLGDAAWKNASRTTADCPVPDCGCKEAYFMQIQIRSADEPSTSFYRCVKCAHNWRD